MVSLTCQEGGPEEEENAKAKWQDVIKVGNNFEEEFLKITERFSICQIQNGLPVMG